MEAAQQVRLHQHILRNAATVNRLDVIASEAAVDALVFAYLRVHSELPYTNTPKHEKWAFGIRHSFIRSDDPDL